jgi:hypothetical protein
MQSAGMMVVEVVVVVVVVVVVEVEVEVVVVVVMEVKVEVTIMQHLLSAPCPRTPHRRISRQQLSNHHGIRQSLQLLL